MAQYWRFPALPPVRVAGTAVTAAALTSGLAGLTPSPELPALPPINADGAKLTLEANIEVTSTSATPTVILGFYIGSVGQAIGSKTVIAVTAALPISATAT